MDKNTITSEAFEVAMRFLADKGLYLWRVNEIKERGSDEMLVGWGFHTFNSSTRKCWPSIAEAVYETLKEIHKEQESNLNVDKAKVEKRSWELHNTSTVLALLDFGNSNG